MDPIAYVGSKALSLCSRRLARIPFHARVLSSGLDFSAWFHFPRSETVTGGTETEENRSMGFLECPQVPFFYRDVPARSRLPW